MTRLKQIHVVNPPAFAEKIMSLFKPFLKEKIVKRICVHKSYDKLLEYFSKDVLPEDYGGTLPPLKELSDGWSAKIVSYRNWFLKEDNVHADESKRPGRNSLDPDIFGIDGSFRKLEID